MRTILMALASTVLLTGCYTSPVPLAGIDQAEFDPGLLGTWSEAEPDSGALPEEVVIQRAGEREYDVRYTYTAPFSGARSTIQGRGYVVRIDGVPFLNLRGVNREEPGWIFLRYERLGDEIQFRSLDERLPVARSAAQLRAFVRRNLDFAGIYTEPARLRRKG